ncbi:BEND6 [Cervus elaphus hippelaphus]|uniref:BEND6 n=1 Tax=Cervus elaphus hippelaphus TaxID=46360 RepID=A0A212D493_CEREH|nr:BEND6 [Cervus elaphus hippelaphus]
MRFSEMKHLSWACGGSMSAKCVRDWVTHSFLMEGQKILAVTQFEELVGMAEALLKGGGTLSTSASTLWRAANNSSPDSFASTCSNSNSNSSSPISLKAEEDHQTDEKQEERKRHSSLFGPLRTGSGLAVGTTFPSGLCGEAGRAEYSSTRRWRRERRRGLCEGGGAPLP